MAELEYLKSSQSELAKHVGMWIAVLGKEIVATGKTAKEAYTKAISQHPGSEPLIAKLPKERAMLL